MDRSSWSPACRAVRAGGSSSSAIEPDRSGVRALLADVLGTPNVGILYTRDGQWIDSDRDAPPIPPRTVGSPRSCASDGDEIAAILHEPEVPLEVVQLGARDHRRRSSTPNSRPRGHVARAEAVRVATAANSCSAGDRAALVLAAEMRRRPARRASNASPRGCVPIRTAVAETARSSRRVTATVRGPVARPRAARARGGRAGGWCSERSVPGRRGGCLVPVEITVYLLAHDDPARDRRGSRRLGRGDPYRRRRVRKPRRARRHSAVASTVRSRRIPVG